MKILIDMNLSPEWVERFKTKNVEAVHWTVIDKPNAKDSEIMAFARDNGYIVFTHDLDFSALLAATQAESPSVIQIRTQDIMSAKLTDIIFNVLTRHEAVLAAGAVVTIDESKARVRILPFRKV